MAKRNLARTAIEGGRHRGCRSLEQLHTRAERHQTRIDLRQLSADRDLADDFVLDDRGGCCRGFADKLGPVYRWLEKQVGFDFEIDERGILVLGRWRRGRPRSAPAKYRFDSLRP
jgi:hypothetical protein